MNYFNTFILTADDCPAVKGVTPDVKEGKVKSIHAIQYTLISQNPYKYTQEDILFMVYAERSALPKNDAKLRSDFFDKSQPCMRSSALVKKYGWGVHFNAEGKAALYCSDSMEYKNFEKGKDKSVKLIKALRNKRA